MAITPQPPIPIEPSKKKYSKEIQDALKNVIDKCELEDQFLRKRHIFEAKENDLYWHSFQYIYWDASQQEFRIPTHESLDRSSSSREETEFVYDYVTNIFKAHGLSIISAISGSDAPGVAFYPADANNPDDVRAAQKAEQLGKVINKKNNSKLQMVHSLFILFTQHILCSYVYYERHEKYGSVKIPKFKKEEVTTQDSYNCYGCQYVSEQPVDICPNCNQPTTLQPGGTTTQLKPNGVVEVNKGFPRNWVGGVLNVRVPSYAEDQEGCGYLIRYSDQPLSYLRDRFPDIRNDIVVGDDESDSYEKLARAPSTTQYYSESYTNNLCTFRQAWLRNWQFECLDDEEKANLLKETFPNGAYCAFISHHVFAEANDECMDESWTITKGDLSRTIHGDPLGKALIQIQDIANTTRNLNLECLEQSVPVNFADMRMLDFTKYSLQEVKPGLTYPVKKPADMQSINDGFSSFKTATVSKEATDLQESIDQDAEFVSGDFPSVFGGSGEGSKTLGEYQESKQNALRRLSIPSMLFYFWWAQVTHKQVKLFIKNMIEDENFTQQVDRRFQATYISRDDFKGKFDLLIPETAGELPVSFGEKRNVIMQAIQSNVPQVLEFLFSPENLRVVLRYFAFEEFTSPGDIQIQKAFRSLSMLLQGQEIIPDQDLDDPVEQLQVFKNYLSSDSGQDEKNQNPEGYQLCINFMKELKQMAIMSQTPPAPPTDKSIPTGKPIPTGFRLLK